MRGSKINNTIVFLLCIVVHSDPNKITKMRSQISSNCFLQPFQFRINTYVVGNVVQVYMEQMFPNSMYNSVSFIILLCIKIF